MFSVTNPAFGRLAQILEQEGDDAVLRFVRVKKRLRLRVGEVHPNDHTFSHAGKIVLALDDPMAKILTLRRLDVTVTKGGPRLRLKSNGEPLK